jgi:predicted DNA-binding transcriptional regulator YafY
MTDLTQQQRRTELHRLLSLGRKVVASELAKQMGCAERTIRRDLLKMRDVERLPVEHDPVAQTWRYTRPVVEIPAMLVTAEDRRVLLFSLQAAAQFEDTPVCGQIRRLYQALLETLPPERITQFERMMKSVRFTGPRTPAIKKSVWDVVLLSLEARETMSITYTDGYYGSTGDREVDPYGLVMRDRHWTLVAYCHRRQEVLTFALHRIAEALSTDKSFVVPADFMDGYLADSFDGTQSTGKKAKVILRIAKTAPKFIQEREWSDRESRTVDTQGNAIVEFHTAALFAVEREIRADEGWVELLEPGESRKRLRETANVVAHAHR